MFLDTNFLISLGEELQGRALGPARTFLRRHRSQKPMVAVISLGELAARMYETAAARDFLARFRIVGLRPEIALAAAEVDRAMIRAGHGLAANDNWIAGYALYYGVPLVSNGSDFKGVQALGLKLLGY